jgi:DNA polymerase-1
VTTRPTFFRSVLVDTPELLARMVAYLSARQREGSWIGFDTEATSTRPEVARLVGMSFAGERAGGFYVPVGHDFGKQVPKAQALAAVAPLLAGPHVVCHGGKYDVRLMRREGVEVALAMDSLSIVRLLGEVEYGVGLKPTIERFYGEPIIEFDDVVAANTTIAQTEIEVALPYAVQDAVYAWRLTVDGIPKLSKAVRDFLLRVEVEAMRHAAEIEDLGTPVDRDWIEGQIAIGHQIIELLRRESIEGLQALAAQRGKADQVPSDLNLNSSAQLSRVLFDVCGLPIIKRSKKTKKPSADKMVIDKLAERHGGPLKKITECRSAQTTVGRLSEFIEFGQEERGWLWVHGSQNPTGTATGRWSHSEPNLGNIGKEAHRYTAAGREWEVSLRSAIVAPPGFVIVTADYSQIELRIAAGESGERAWWDAFTNDGDIHTATAAAVFGVVAEQVTKDQRQRGKTLNFSMLYGAQADTISERLGITKDASERLISGFWAGLPGVRSWVDRVHASVQKLKYVETHFGRRRWLREIDSDEVWVRNGAQRESVNTIIQGTAADILKIGMLRQRPLVQRFGAKVFLTVHDQYVWLVPEMVSPGEFCREAEKLICWEIEGYPRIVCDFSMGRSFGSLVAFKSSAEVPEAFSDVREVQTQRAQRVVTLSIASVTKEDARRLKELIASRPGGSLIVLDVAGHEYRVGTSSLGVSDSIEFKAVLGDAVRVTES